MMRAVHEANIAGATHVVVLTRPEVLRVRARITVAPVRSRARGLSVEVKLGARNGVPRGSVVDLDCITTVSVRDVGRFVGQLDAHQDADLAHAVIAAFDLPAAPTRPGAASRLTW